MDSEKSGEKDKLGAYKSNGMGGQKLSTVMLHLPFSWSVFSLDFPNFRNFKVFLLLNQR